MSSKSNHVRIKTSFGKQLFLLIFFVSILAVGVLWAYYGLYFIANYNSLIHKGVETKASIVRLKRKTECANGNINYEIQYKFEVEGQAYTGALDSACNGALDKNKPTDVPLRYLARDPYVHIVAAPFASQYLAEYRPYLAALAPSYLGICLSFLGLTSLYVQFRKPRWSIYWNTFSSPKVTFLATFGVFLGSAVLLGIVVFIFSKI